MSNYRRLYEGKSWFFTLVTQRRAPLLCQDDTRATLGQVVREARERWPFTVDAWVLLPDHLHCLWSLPETDVDFSRRWGWIKKECTKRVRDRVALPGGTLWQACFWEHRIRDDVDFERHCAYIHYNPVKHGLCKSLEEWPWSTLHRFKRDGVYPTDWGRTAPNLPEDVGSE